MLSELAYPHIRHCSSTNHSDLKKSTVVNESLSPTNNYQFCSREEIYLLQLIQQNEKSTQIQLDCPDCIMHAIQDGI